MSIKKKLTFLVCLFFLLVFLPSFVSAERLYTWGVASPISYDSDANVISSFDGFDYKIKPNGVFEIWKNDVQQARYGFGMTGTFQGSPVNPLSTDFDWDWTVIQNDLNRIELEGKRANYDSVPFKWKINLVVERFKEIKIFNYIENTTAFDVTDLEFFYLFDVNTIQNPIVEYIDENGTTQQYDYSTNFLRQNPNGLPDLLLNRVNVPFFNFQFQDMVDENYFLTALYFGNLNDLRNNLPDTNGFIVGFSKGNKRLNAGQSHLIDPTIFSEQGDTGYMVYRNGVWLAKSTTQMFTGHNTFSGSYDWDRAIFEFVFVSGLRQRVKKADLFLTVHSVSGSEAGFWDLNHIEALDFQTLNIDETDWNSATRSKVRDNWFDENTAVGPISTSVLDAWNNTVDDGNSFMAFRIGLDNEPSYTSTSDEIRIRLCNYGETIGICDGSATAPYIEFEFEVSFDLNITSPSGGNFIKKDANTLIQFDIHNQNGDSNYFGIHLGYDDDIAWDNPTGAGSTLIVEDLNLFAAARFPTIDVNCSLGSAGFGAVSTCFYDFNFSTGDDGNYFIDANFFLYDLDSNWAPFSTSTSFYLDGTKPTTTWDGNAGTWQNTDANVFLTCDDGSGSGCSITAFRLDTDSTSAVSFGAWQTYDTNIFFGLDGNWAVDFNSMDIVTNIEETNTHYVLLDKIAPVSLSFVPDSNSTTTTDTTPDFNSTFSDASNTVSICGFRVTIDGNVDSFGTTSAVDGNCMYTLVTDLTDGQTAFLDWNATDSIGNTSDYNRGFSITYNTPAVGGGDAGGGAGGGGEPASLANEGSFCLITDNCLLGLECIENVCSDSSTDRLIEAASLVVTPREITSSPFEDVLPNFRVQLTEIFVSNVGFTVLEITGEFRCSQDEFCAKDWCRITSGLGEIGLQPQGLKIVTAECDIPPDAVIGETYFTQLIFSTQSGAEKGVAIIIPVKEADIFSAGGIFFEGTNLIGGFFDYGLICVGTSKENCLYTIPNSEEFVSGLFVFNGFTVMHGLIAMGLIAIAVSNGAIAWIAFTGILAAIGFMGFLLKML